MLQSSVEQTYNLPIIHRVRTEKTHNQLGMVCAFGILAALVFIEHLTGTLQVRSRFQTVIILFSECSIGNSDDPQKTADQRWSEPYVATTMILCCRNL